MHACAALAKDFAAGSANRRQHRGHVAEIVEDEVRGVRRQFGAGEFAGGDGDGLRADGPRAGDVVRGVAEDEDALGREVDAVAGVGARLGEMAELVAVGVIVGVGAKLEVMPDAVVPQLDLRAAGEIAGEQGEDDVRARLQRLEQREDAGQQAARRARDLQGEVVQVHLGDDVETFEWVLAASGRPPNIAGLGLANTTLALTPDGSTIPIEERNSREVTHVGPTRMTPEAAHVRNPAFDVTPNKYVTAIITERGIARPPYTESLLKLVHIP